MNKTLKKTLSIILAILMIVTTVPFAFAAGDGVKTTIDVTEFNDLYLYLDENRDYYDEDGYIFTGAKDGLVITVYHSCDIILNNLSAGAFFFNESAEKVNFTLEGDNYLNYPKNLASFSVYRSHITIDGGEDDTLTCTSGAGIFTTSGNRGSVTVNGGVIKGTSNVTDNFHSISCYGGFTMNGGEVTVSNNFSYVLSGNITLNAGVLNVISTTEKCEASSADISIAKGALLTVSAKTEAFSGKPDITAVDEEMYLFARFDTESEFLPTKNISKIVSDKTYVEITADEHTHSYNEESFCVCGEECLHETVTNGECELCKKTFFAITHQPTADEPYVETNVDDATYQWLEVEYHEEEITDDNEITEGIEYNDDKSFYDEATGWNGVRVGEDGIIYFYVYLEKGQQIKLVPSDFCEMLIIAGFNSDYSEYEIGVAAGEEVVFTAQDDGWCQVYAFISPENTPTLRAYRLIPEYSEFVGETSAELKNIEVGKAYVCEVTYRNGETEMSDSFRMPYRITHQPTADENYVELNDDTNAVYQWYGVEETKTEHTNENATAYSYDDETATYDAENGWTPVEDSYGDYSSVTISAEAGDEIIVEVSESGFGGVGIFDYNQETGDYSEEKDGTLIYSFIVPKSGEYTVYTDYFANCKAYKHVIEYTLAEGQTSEYFIPTELGTFVCEVTFADGSKEISDIFEATHICEHICHSNNWFVKAIWSIVNFFLRLFNAQQYCTCRVPHYDAPFFG